MQLLLAPNKRNNLNHLFLLVLKRIKRMLRIPKGKLAWAKNFLRISIFPTANSCTSFYH